MPALNNIPVGWLNQVGWSMC